MKNFVTESIRNQTSEEVKCKETARFEERYGQLERKIMQEEDTTTAAREYTEDEPAAISEHSDGLNETTATADTRTVEAAYRKNVTKQPQLKQQQQQRRSRARKTFRSRTTMKIARVKQPRPMIKGGAKQQQQQR